MLQEIIKLSIVFTQGKIFINDKPTEMQYETDIVCLFFLVRLRSLVSYSP